MINTDIAIVIAVFIALVVIYYRFEKKSNRSACENNCLFYKRGECNFYGNGHIAKADCKEYMLYVPKNACDTCHYKPKSNDI